MNSKLKKILIPFILVFIFDVGFLYLSRGQDWGAGITPHTGLFFISGLLFGPYGALGAASASLLGDLVGGYSWIEAILSSFISFGVSCFAYKLWYTRFFRSSDMIMPALRDTRHVLKFMGMIIFLGVLSVLFLREMLFLINPHYNSRLVSYRYFLNYINASFIFGILGIWFSKKIDFVHLPSISKRDANNKFYAIVLGLLVIVSVAMIFVDYFNDETYLVEAVGFASSMVLLYCYITRPNKEEIKEFNHSSITEKVTNIFLLLMLLIMISSIYLSYETYFIILIQDYVPVIDDLPPLVLLSVDLILLAFFIPLYIILRYIEERVVNPIVSFSEIGGFINQGEKIESEGLIDVYSDYESDDTEIGVLARSYIDLITYNNYYIENIHEIEGEKERIKAELNIARRIQQSNLPTEAIENEFFKVNGYSHAAKEVGGDFFDYYQLDEDNLAMVIGDASGKGVPAALLATTTQSLIKQLLNQDLNPANILYDLNNQLCENNSEFMFISLWLGIYNKSTNILTFSNAGHSLPLLKQNGKFEYFEGDEGLVLGVRNDFEFKKEEINLTEEIVLYTDGIPDANNVNSEMYGEINLKNFFNSFRSDVDPIKPLFEEVKDFMGGREQFDDMTVLYLKVKK